MSFNTSSNVIGEILSAHEIFLECDGKKVKVKLSWNVYQNTVDVMRVGRKKTAIQAVTSNDLGARGAEGGAGRIGGIGRGAGGKARSQGHVGNRGQEGGREKARHDWKMNKGTGCYFWVPY